MRDWLTLVMGILILFFVIWLFALQVSSSKKKAVPCPDDHKFFMTTSPEFSSVYIDWEYQNVSILGDNIPFQTVQITPNGENKVFFKFTGRDDKGNDVEGDGSYDRLLDQVLLMFGDNSLELHSSSPKNLLENVQAVYSKSRNFRRQ